jgi:hypothetical protein
LDYGGAHYSYSPHGYYGSSYYHGGYGYGHSIYSEHAYGYYDHWGYPSHGYYGYHYYGYPAHYGVWFGGYRPGYYSYYYPTYASVTYYDTAAYGYVTGSSTNASAPTYGYSLVRGDASQTQFGTPATGGPVSDGQFLPRLEIPTQQAPEALPDESKKGIEQP